MPRALALALLCLLNLIPISVFADDLGNPIGALSTTSIEASEASLQIEVDKIKAERDFSIRKLGNRHPQIEVLDARLSRTQQSLAKLQKRNENLDRKESASMLPNVQSSNPTNNEIVIQLQQMILNLTNRVNKLEDEVRELKTAMKIQAESK